MSPQEAGQAIQSLASDPNLPQGYKVVFILLCTAVATLWAAVVYLFRSREKIINEIMGDLKELYRMVYSILKNEIGKKRD